MTTVTKTKETVAPQRKAKRPLWMRLRQSPAAAALLFLAPGLLFLVVLRIAPAVSAVASSLFHYSLLRDTTSFVGFDNYATLFRDSDFHQAVLVTLLFNVIINPLQIAVSLALAVLLNQKLAGVRFWRALVFLPIAVPPAVSAVVWDVAFQPNGLINAFLRVFGLPAQPFLTSGSQALWSIMILCSWIGVGYWMMFLISGLNDIPTSLYEASTLDGAGAWKRFWYITFPMLRRPLAFVLVADTVSNFLVFAPVQILTNGGPENATNLAMFDIYRRAFTLGNMNLAQAEVVLLMLVTLVVVAVQFRLLRSKE
ncbi:carbohydrate ABC transporter permease [Actinocatenispora rupis]|uniref:ABC transporter permease n=1 Tax=Actinocatenispora rupis TaxID=519421 RepID=A0A8J3JBB0_9ACTN|nr:sugar ABC transporter permease [Actinocatenispora rupis]GID12853.1 ABC transporter permease [Actinocatenispora rupis]